MPEPADTDKNGNEPEDPQEGHHDFVAQPHTDEEGSVAEAEAEAAELSTKTAPLGEPGRKLDRKSPFFIGMLGAAGVAVTYLVAQLIVTAQDTLVLIGLSLFIAIGLEPAVSWLARHRFPRWAAVLTVLLALVLIGGGFLAAAIPVIVEQATAFAHQAPQYLQDLKDHNSPLGQLNDRFGIQQHLQQLLSGGAGTFEGALSAGKAVLGTVGDLLIVIVLTIYFLADFPRIRAGLYRLVPHTRRPRTILIGDEIFAKVGGYVLGNALISLIAGAVAFVWLLIFGVPYALLLAILVALLDLVPVLGTAIAGIGVSLVALTVSWPVALATAGFFLVYRLVEDYLLVPRIIGKAVEVPALVTVVAVLLSGVLLGVVGALVAIPIAAALLLILREVASPRLDQA
jgi:predicted PurR-regulated permease PerM